MAGSTVAGATADCHTVLEPFLAHTRPPEFRPSSLGEHAPPSFGALVAASAGTTATDAAASAQQTARRALIAFPLPPGGWCSCYTMDEVSQRVKWRAGVQFHPQSRPGDARSMRWVLRQAEGELLCPNYARRPVRSGLSRHSTSTARSTPVANDVAGEICATSAPPSLRPSPRSAHNAMSPSMTCVSSSSSQPTTIYTENASVSAANNTPAPLDRPV